MASPRPDPFSAIAHPARRRLLDLLAKTDHSVSAMSAHFAMSRPAVSQHLRVLLDAGLVTEHRHGRQRLYHLRPDRLAPVRDWLAQYEQFWDDRLARLQHLVTTKNTTKNTTKKRSPR